MLVFAYLRASTTKLWGDRRASNSDQRGPTTTLQFSKTFRISFSPMKSQFWKYFFEFLCCVFIGGGRGIWCFTTEDDIHREKLCSELALNTLSQTNTHTIQYSFCMSQNYLLFFVCYLLGNMLLSGTATIHNWLCFLLFIWHLMENFCMSWVLCYK